MSKVTPCLWFDGTAEQAARLHCSVFQDSKMIMPAEPTSESGNPPPIVIWEVMGQRLMGINGGPNYRLSPSFSLMIDCANQAEVDRYWDALTADGGQESMCGWLEDKYGVSFQIVPQQLAKLMGGPDPEKAGRVREALFKMRKIIVADLEAAHAGM